LVNNAYKEYVIFIIVPNNVEWLDKLVAREDKLYSSRVNFFILTQSLLFASYATLFTKGSGIICLIISIFGMVLCGYFYVIFLSTVRYLVYLRHNLKVNCLEYDTIWRNREYKKTNNKKIYEIPGVNFSLGPGLSICFSVVWFYLCIFLIELDIFSIKIISIIMLLVIWLILLSNHNFIKKHKPKNIGNEIDYVNDESVIPLLLFLFIIIALFIIFIIILC